MPLPSLSPEQRAAALEKAAEIRKARAELKDRARGLDIGGVDYVTKPFNPIELAPLVREAIAAAERGEREAVRSEKIAALRGLFESG